MKISGVSKSSWHGAKSSAGFYRIISYRLLVIGQGPPVNAAAVCWLFVAGGQELDGPGRGRHHGGAVGQLPRQAGIGVGGSGREQLLASPLHEHTERRKRRWTALVTAQLGLPRRRRRPRARPCRHSLIDVLFGSSAVLDPTAGHTMDLLSPFIPVLCHSD